MAFRSVKFRPFKEARNYVHTLKIKNQDHWALFSKSGNRPNDIPSNPQTTYSERGWISWGDWLGTGTIADINKPFRSFIGAREFVHTLKLKNIDEWKAYIREGKKPSNIPSKPEKIYKSWISWGDWLGTGNIAKSLMVFRTFDEAREYVRSLNLKSGKDWKRYCTSGNKPKDIPSNPHTTYKNKGWTSYVDWLNLKHKNNDQEEIHVI